MTSASANSPPEITFETTHGGLPILKLDFDARTPAEIDLERCVLRLSSSNGKEVILVGTAHVSKDSAETTERIIREERPEIIFIELDKNRLEKLLLNRSLGEREVLKKTVEKIRDIPSALKFVMSNLKDVPGFVYQLGGLIVGSPAGNEFTKAIEVAGDIGALVVLGDRSAEVTASRVMQRVRYGSKEKRREERRRREKDEERKDAEKSRGKSARSRGKIRVRGSRESAEMFEEDFERRNERGIAAGRSKRGRSGGRSGGGGN